MTSSGNTSSNVDELEQGTSSELWSFPQTLQSDVAVIDRGRVGDIGDSRLGDELWSRWWRSVALPVSDEVRGLLWKVEESVC